MDKNWRQRLDKLIVARGFSRKSLSKAASFGETYLRDVIDFDRDPGVERLSTICGLLGVSLEQVLFESGAISRLHVHPPPRKTDI